MVPAGEAWIWRDLTFDLKARDRLAVAGPSGVGKTLLLRAVAGLDPLDEGRIALEDRPRESWSIPAFRSRVCYLHQRPALLDGSVEENLRRPFALEVHRSRSFDEAEAVALLERLGRSGDLLRQRASNLSGGEAQLVALLRALLPGPSILLLDEPTASLDAETTQRVEAMILEWVTASAGRALLWTSHDPSQLSRIATRRLVLERGHDGAARHRET